MMLSELDAWVRDDSDFPETDLGPPMAGEEPLDEGSPIDGGPSGGLSANGHRRGDAIDLDDFLGDYEQQQTHIWSAAEAPLYPQGPPRPVDSEGPRDSWPLLPPQGACGGTSTSSHAKPSGAPAAEREVSGVGAPKGSRGPPFLPGPQLYGARGPSVGPPGEGPLGGHLMLLRLWCKSLKGPPWLPVCFSEVREACKKAYYSQLMGLIYLGVLGLNVWILLKCLLQSPVDAPLVVAETFVTLMLVLEVSLRALVMGRAFFASCAHLFDCGVAALCLALLCGSGDLQALGRGPGAPGSPGGPKGSSGSPDELLRQSLTALRIATQLVRIVPLAMHQKRARLPRDGVDFSRVNSGDDL